MFLHLFSPGEVASLRKREACAPEERVRLAAMTKQEKEREEWRRTLQREGKRKTHERVFV